MTIFMHAREVSWLSTHGVGGGYIDVIHVYIPKLWMLLVWQKFQGNVMSSAEMLCYYTGMVLCMPAAYIHVRLACVHVVGGNGERPVSWEEDDISRWRRAQIAIVVLSRIGFKSST